MSACERTRWRGATDTATSAAAPAAPLSETASDVRCTRVILARRAAQASDAPPQTSTAMCVGGACRRSAGGGREVEGLTDRDGRIFLDLSRRRGRLGGEVR